MVDGYRGVAVKPGKGVEHAGAVARELREAGCRGDVEVAGLLHDVVEDTTWTVDDVRTCFGTTVASLVAAVTEDDAIVDYRARKRALREHIAAAGGDAVDIALADKVASLRYVLSAGRKLPKRKRAHYAAVASLGAHATHPALAAQVLRLLAAVDARDKSLAAAG